MVGGAVMELRSQIADMLSQAGVPDVRVSIDNDDADGAYAGGFAIESAYGFMRLYLPSDLVESYDHDGLARQKVHRAISELIICCRARA